MMEEEHPSGARLMAALACAVAVAAVGAAALWSRMLGQPAPGLFPLILMFGLPIAAAHALILGLPVYLLLRRRWTLRWWSAALGGFAVAVVPAGLLSSAPGSGMSLTVLRELAELGLLGLAGGVAFWIVLRDPPSHRF
jgi:hypothetical protein